MANLTYIPNAAEKGYTVINLDTGVSVGFFVNKEVAVSVVKSGNDSASALAVARQQDINLSGGIQTSTPPLSNTDGNVTYSGSVTYTGSRSLTPEQQQELVNRRNANGPAPVNTVVDPLYAGGTRPAVTEEEIRTGISSSPPAISNPPDPTVPSSAALSQSNIPPGNVTTAPQAVQDDNAQALDRENAFIYNERGELVPADSPYALSSQAQTVNTGDLQLAPQPVGGNYTEAYNPETGKWDVYDLTTGQVVQTDLSEQQATLTAQDLAMGGTGYAGISVRNYGVAYDDDGNLMPGYTLDEDNNPVYVGGNFVEPATAASAEASRIAALAQQAQQQKTVSELRKANGKAVGDGDWRVRLRLAPDANYLYKTPGINTAGIMEPLRQTDGVVFPYTPQIDMAYNAEYNAQDLVHNNYRGYFYKGSKVGEITITADFTAQDSYEADYLLATIHFFRSCTKMFYGQDTNRGAPPPMVFLSGLGTFQFNEHPCVVSQFNYNLPKDVDYIRARGRQSTSAGVTQGGDGLLWRRTLTSTSAPSYSLSSIWSRLTGANIPQGGINYPPAPPNLGTNTPTYVPTKMSMTLTLLPMPTRAQVSQQFSLDKYANGNLLRGGFW